MSCDCYNEYSYCALHSPNGRAQTVKNIITEMTSLTWGDGPHYINAISELSKKLANVLDYNNKDAIIADLRAKLAAAEAVVEAAREGAKCSFDSGAVWREIEKTLSAYDALQEKDKK